MAEITQTGYKLKTQNEWFDEERQMYLDIDPMWNLDPSTPDGLKLAHDSEVFGAFDETLQQAYNSKDPNKASGVDLNILSALTGTSRSEGSASTVAVTMTGTPNSAVLAGFRIKSRTTGTVWTLDQQWTLDSTGTVVGNFTCITMGPTEADANTLTLMVDTAAGLTAVNNPQPATPGTSVENDSSLRVKRATAVGRPGNNQIDSALGEIYAVNGVRRVRIYENDTDSSTVSPDNPHGLPRHSIAPVVDGGTDSDVAMAIYIKKNPGCTLYQAGTPVTVDVTSPQYPDNIKTIRFSRPVYVDMNVSVTIKNDGSLPSNVEELIRDAFIEFADGGLVPAEYGFKVDGFDIGESVPYSTLFTPINKVIGQYGNSFVQTMTLNGASANVNIAYNQLSRWTRTNITVVVV